MKKNKFASEPYVNEGSIPIGLEYGDDNLPKPGEDRLDEVDPFRDISFYINSVTTRRDIDMIFDRFETQPEFESGMLRKSAAYLFKSLDIIDSMDETVERPFSDEIVEEVKSKRKQYGIEEWDEDGVKDLVAEYMDRNLDVVKRRHGDHRDLDHFVRMMENYWIPSYK